MKTTIAEIMSKKIETIEESASVQELALKMKDKNISSLMVVDSFGKSKGLVTERDLIRKVCVKDICTSQVIIKEIMSLPLITINQNESPSTAIDLMLQHNIRHLLVVDDDETEINKPIGIVTPRDLSRYQEFTRDDVNKDNLEKILEYFI
ncbi:MAG TPA: CBS domain-containing protein [Nitrososphaeraceae archaeon]|jgi:CBS domain-containing protein|nr:CBS domain-containing protein [Nitrososphaeraceae archaeon]